MNKALLRSIFTVLVCLACAGMAQSQTTNLQVINNAADPAAVDLDVYLNGSLVLDDLAFRTARTVTTAPTSVPVTIVVAPGSSTAVGDSLATVRTATLDSSKNYIAIITGVIDTAQFAVNPDSIATGLQITLIEDTTPEAVSADSVNLFFAQGVPDARVVDVIIRGGATLVNNALYNDVVDSISVAAKKYIFDVSAGNNTVVNLYAFKADLRRFAGGSVVILSSGFWDPEANEDGPVFGLFAVLPNDSIVALPLFRTARVQAIHNAPDPAASEFDVYVDSTMLIDDFAFRTATPYLEVEAEVPIAIAFAPSNSDSVGDAIFTASVTLDSGQTYVAIASGVLDTSQFAVNPDSIDIGVTILTKAGARTEANSPDSVDFFVVHGSPDAPTIDIEVRDDNTLVDDASYGDVSDYISLLADEYILDVTASDTAAIDSGDFESAAFDADLDDFNGLSAVLLASGFVDSTANQNGRDFALLLVLADGTVIELPRREEEEEATAFLQLINNAPDSAAASVDVFVNGDQLVDDLAFREATAYLEVPANETLNILVAGNLSSTDSLTAFTTTLDENQAYVAIVSGVRDSSQFIGVPDSLVGFALLVKTQGRQLASDSTNFEFFAAHGSPDAGAVDVSVRNGATLVDDANYGDLTDYISVSPDQYTLDVTVSNDDDNVLGSFLADFRSFANRTGVLLASGFLSPDSNSSDPSFALVVVLDDGTVLVLSAVRERVITFGESGDEDYDDVASESHIREISYAQDRNYGATDNIRVKGRNEPAKEWRGLLKFDFVPGLQNEGVTESDDIISAKISLYLSEAEGNREDELTIYRLLRDWNEGNKDNETATQGEVTWLSARKGEEDWGSAGITGENIDFESEAAASISVGNDAGTWYEIDVTASAQAIFDDEDNNGWLLVLEEGAEMRYFSSSEWSDPAFRPRLTIEIADTSGGVSAIDDLKRNQSLPASYAMAQNYPNPFNPTTTIKYDIPATTLTGNAQNHVLLQIFNVTGQVVKTLVDAPQAPGKYTVQWDATNNKGVVLPSGVYFYRIQTGSFSRVMRMVLMK